MNNPWLHVDNYTQRRIEVNSFHNIFWIKDPYGHYGMMIQCNENFNSSFEKFRLKGIDIMLDSSQEPNQLYLLLKDNLDWEIFAILCNDLIQHISNEEKGVLKVFERLKRWQSLLQKRLPNMMSIEEQMGLISELITLRNYVIPNYGLENGVNGWVGALGDKQDFLLENCALEVKSHRASKGNFIWVSSKEQLNSEKEPLFLIVYTLIQSRDGISINTIFEEIRNKLLGSLSEEFIEKVEQYGYIEEVMKSQLAYFIVEKVQFYEVTDGFPKLHQSTISSLIEDVKYKINLSGCEKFEVKMDRIFKVGEIVND